MWVQSPVNVAERLLDGAEKFLAEILHHLTARPDILDKADALADEIADQFAGFVIPGRGGAFDAGEGGFRHHSHQRHGQRAGAVLGIPCIVPNRFQLPRRFAGPAAGADCVAAARGDHLLAERFGGLGLGCRQPDRARPRALRPGGHHSGHLAAGHDAASREYGNIVTCSGERTHDFGDQNKGGDFAAMAACLAALCDDDIDARFGLPDGMFLRADQCGDGNTAAFAFLDHGRRSDAQRIGDQPDGMAKCDFHQRKAVFGCDTEPIGQDFDLVLCRYAVLREDVIGMLLVGGVDRPCARGIVAQARHRRVDDLRHKNIDTVGRAVHMGIDPGQLFFQRFGAETRRAENAEAASLADRCDDVAAMGERKERKLRTGHRAHAVHCHIASPSGPIRLHNAPSSFRRSRRRSRRAPSR